jgi:hypothetical protein
MSIADHDCHRFCCGRAAHALNQQDAKGIPIGRHRLMSRRPTISSPGIELRAFRLPIDRVPSPLWGTIKGWKKLSADPKGSN